MPEVFISHSSKDKPAADAACAMIERRGLKCWVAPRDILPGEEWADGILRGIESCSAMVVVFSRAANESPQVRREVERAVAKGLAVVPFRIEEVLPTKAMEYFISSAHWLDAFPAPLHTHLEKLAGTLLGVLGRGPVQSVRQPAPARRAIRNPLARHLRTAAVIVAAAALAAWAYSHFIREKGEAPASSSPAAFVATPAPAPLPVVAATPAPTPVLPPVEIAPPLPPPRPVVIATPVPAPSVSPVVTAAAWELVSATKEQPFKNSLGMEFVPVPGAEVLFCRWETRVRDYRAFADATKRVIVKTDFAQTPEHPAVNISWEDAKAFCAWLSKKEGRDYRLPSDVEWSIAVGLPKEDGDTPEEKEKDTHRMVVDFPWGVYLPPPDGAGNYLSSKIAGYSDDFLRTAPVGSFHANRAGIHDLGGNAWEWCEDVWRPGTAERVMRGASYANFLPQDIKSSKRGHLPPAERSDQVGFRIVVGGLPPVR